MSERTKRANASILFQKPGYVGWLFDPCDMGHVARSTTISDVLPIATHADMFSLTLPVFKDTPPLFFILRFNILGFFYFLKTEMLSVCGF